VAKNNAPVLTGEFVKTPIALLNDRALTDAELRLWLVLAAHCMDGGDVCFPSVSRLAGILGKSARQITNTLGRLEAKGHVKRQFQKGKSSNYELARSMDPRRKLQGLSHTPEENFGGGVKKTSMDPRRKLHPETDVFKQKNIKESTSLPAGPVPGKRKSQKNPQGKDADPRVNEILHTFCAQYQDKFSAPYTPAYGRDNKHFKDLLVDHSLEILTACITEFFNDSDPWLNGKRTVGIFRSRINGYVQERTVFADGTTDEDKAYLNDASIWGERPPEL